MNKVSNNSDVNISEYFADILYSTTFYKLVYIFIKTFYKACTVLYNHSNCIRFIVTNE